MFLHSGIFEDIGLSRSDYLPLKESGRIVHASFFGAVFFSLVQLLSFFPFENISFSHITHTNHSLPLPLLPALTAHLLSPRSSLAPFSLQKTTDLQEMRVRQDKTRYNKTKVKLMLDNIGKKVSRAGKRKKSLKNIVLPHFKQEILCFKDWLLLIWMEHIECSLSFFLCASSMWKPKKHLIILFVCLFLFVVVGNG